MKSHEPSKLNYGASFLNIIVLSEIFVDGKLSYVIIQKGNQP